MKLQSATPHFVSASCAGTKCVCGRAATHKFGEEIMHDEPCMQCGEQYVSDMIDPRGSALAKSKCGSYFHHRGPHAQRHNLTSYVCCFHWSLILGPATGCPLDDKDKSAMLVFRYAHDPDRGFGPLVELVCPSCNGKLRVTGENPTNVIIDCTACGTGCFVTHKEKSDAP